MNNEIEPTVAVIDDDDALRDAMSMMLEAAGLKPEGFPTAEAFLAVVGSGSFGCAVIDVRLPGMDGMALFHKLQADKVNMPVVIVTGHGDVPMAVEALKAGAVDFIEKPFDPDRLLEGIRQALSREIQVRRDQSAVEELHGLLARLTPREREVMDFMVMGHSNKAIASKLGISPRTVEIYRARVMEKMNVRTLAELVRLAMRLER